MARRRKIPRNQYFCDKCGRCHVRGSQRGRDCRNTVHKQQVRTAPPTSGSAQHRGHARPEAANGASFTGSAIGTALDPGRNTSSSAVSVLPRGPVRELVLHSSDYYSTIATQLRANTPWSRRKFSGTHWLCRRLDDLSKQLDPATFAQLARQPVSDGLRSLGFPGFVAEVLGAASALGAKQALGAIPMTHLGEFLRVLIPFVCPDFAHCPAHQDACETFRVPTVCDHLQELTDGSG